MELKSYKMVDEKYCTDCVCVIPSEVYLKSEADKVIAEFKDIDSKNRSAYYTDLVMMAKDVERHKYKRCLAMAKWCNGLHQFHEAIERNIWLHKWHKRWLDIAEKFKPNKEA